MRYTLRNVPKDVDCVLRQRARWERKSLNQVVLEAIAQGLGMTKARVVRRKLGDLAGTWQDDPEFDAALADQHRS